jgi:Tol biopolymer transport system component
VKKLFLTLTILALFLAACSSATPTSSNATSSVGLGTPPPTLQPGTLLSTAQPSVWGKFGLSGRLVLIEFNPDGNRLFSLDLTTGARTLLYQAPQRSLLSGAAVSPDGKQILLVYAPPPPPDGSLTASNLYLMPADGSSLPQVLVTSATSNDLYYIASWAPDGQSIYSSYYHPADSQKNTPDQYAVVKISLDGQVTPVIQNAIWPVISPDRTQMAYLTASASTSVNDLYVANLDGSNPVPVIPGNAYASVDAHLFTPDGKSLIFSAVNPVASIPPSTSWLEKLLGITVASAHSVPSDWYMQKLGDGSSTRLTEVADTGMNAAISPDGKNMAFVGSQGIYNYNFASGKAQLLSNLYVVGTICWLP